MKKTFLFQPVRPGVVIMRRYSCWCASCMQAWAPGEGTMTSSYACVGCPSSAHLPWMERSIERTDAVGISNARIRSLKRARSLSEQLQAHFAERSCTGRESTMRRQEPVWIAVQNRGEADDDQYWIGQATGIVEVHQTSGVV